MDGFDSNRGVIIMAATNRPETLDAALLRPGRFDRTVVVDRPDINGREAILKVHVRNVKLGPDVDLRRIASLTPGSVGADLANLVNEAALMAARKRQQTVTHGRVRRGRRARRRRPGAQEPDHERRREAARRLSRSRPRPGRLLPAEHPPGPQGLDHPARRRALGAMSCSRPEEDRYLMTHSELESHIKVCLGGTLAEELIFGEISNGRDQRPGASEPHRPPHGQGVRHEPAGPRHSTRRRRPMLPAGGLSARLREYSEETAREIDLEVRKIIDDATDEVRAILARNQTVLEAVAQRLMEKEVIDGAELHELLKAGGFVQESVAVRIPLPSENGNNHAQAAS